MKSNAPGQLLGYAIQFPRALFHLVRSEKGDSVCIEVFGDVSHVQSSGHIVTEEDKSSICGNPLTDRSVELWKTFYNWIQAIKSETLPKSKTKFLLYSNQNGRKSIAHRFSSAKTAEEVKSAVEFAKNKLKNLDDKHDAWSFYDFCINQECDLLSQVITQFELCVQEKSTGYKEIKLELEKILIPESQTDFVLESMGGWLQKKVMEKIINNESAIISWEEYRHQFTVLYEKVRKRELIDFTLQNIPNEDDLKKVIKIRPCYVRQLDKIGASDDEILGAVADYLRASVNREKWIEQEIIDEEIAADFESRLNEFWKNQKKKIELIYADKTPEQKGQILLLNCKERQETIRDMTPPVTTISGTYHALADSPVIGWHYEWEKEFLK